MSLMALLRGSSKQRSIYFFMYNVSLTFPRSKLKVRFQMRLQLITSYVMEFLYNPTIHVLYHCMSVILFLTLKTKNDCISIICLYLWTYHVALVVKNLPASVGDARDRLFNPWVGKIPSRRVQQPTPVFFPGESHGQRSPAGSVHRIAKSRTQLKQSGKPAYFYSV